MEFLAIHRFENLQHLSTNRCFRYQCATLFFVHSIRWRRLQNKAFPRCRDSPIPSSSFAVAVFYLVQPDLIHVFVLLEHQLLRGSGSRQYHSRDNSVGEMCFVAHHPSQGRRQGEKHINRQFDGSSGDAQTYLSFYKIDRIDDRQKTR